MRKRWMSETYSLQTCFVCSMGSERKQAGPGRMLNGPPVAVARANAEACCRLADWAPQGKRHAHVGRWKHPKKKKKKNMLNKFKHPQV